MNKVIKLPIYDIVVTLKDDPFDDRQGGSITSALDADLPHYDEDDPVCMILDAMLSIILGHACAGVDIEDPKYIQGLETAIDNMFNTHIEEFI